MNFTQEETNKIMCLRNKVNTTLFECRNALVLCEWNLEIAQKYIEGYPTEKSFDFWMNKDYKYCEACHKFHIVPKGTNKCIECGYDLKGRS